MKIRNAFWLFLMSSAAMAGHISETLTLTNGWNAVYLESTPDATDPATFETTALGSYGTSASVALPFATFTRSPPSE